LVLLPLGVAALAFFVRFRLLVHTGGVLGSDGYDDGVYYAAADALVHGRLPYRDFLLLQPPGTIVALAPFAWLGTLTTDPTGETAARIGFILVGALNSVLVATISRRFGLGAALLAGFGYAVFLPAAYGERSTLLEPLGTCALLASVLLVRRSWQHPRLGPVLAGAAGGIALGMRIWFVVPVAVIALVHRRSLLPYVVGAAAAGLALYLPFFAASPSALVREVVLDQLGRSRELPGTLRRIDTVLGAMNLHLQQPWSALLSAHKVGLLLAGTVLVLGVAAWTVRSARLFPLVAASTSLVLLISPTFFLHYGALTAPWLVLTAAVGATKLVSFIRERRLRILIAVLLLAAFAGQDLRAVQVARSSEPIPVASLRSAAQHVPGCVISDDPQTLIALDVLSRDLRLGCTVWPDVTGYTYDRDSVKSDGRSVPRTQNLRWQTDVARYLRSGSAVIVHRAATDLSPRTNRLVRSGPVLAKSADWTLHAVSR
jgi:hypothetical protein